MFFDHFIQKLLEMQEEYSLKKVGEQGIDIKTENFDASSSQVTVQFSVDNVEKEQWGPTKRHDVNWNQEKGVFCKVSSH